MTIDELRAGIQADDPAVRSAAWNAADSLGAEAIAPLAELTTHGELEVRRSATRGLWVVTRAAGLPGEDTARHQAATALLPLIEAGHGDTLRRDALWMLAELASDAEVPAIAALLADDTVRDDARMALEKIPGEASLAALRAGLAAAPEDFQPAIAHSLQVRGDSVEGVPSLRMVPQRPTAITRLRGEAE